MIDIKIWYKRRGFMEHPYSKNYIEGYKYDKRYDNTDAFEDNFDISINEVFQDLTKTHILINEEKEWVSITPNELYAKYNNDYVNPLSHMVNPEKQLEIRDKKSHTSMSIGDIIETNNVFWVVMPVGFHQIVKKSLNTPSEIFN